MNSLYECQDGKLTDRIEISSKIDPVNNEMLKNVMQTKRITISVPPY